MATHPEDRYPTPRALADDLERWMADEPVAAWREPQPAVSPHSSMLLVSPRFLVGSVRGLGGEPVLPRDHFDECKVERRGGRVDSE
jgi:hypothetical protein